MLHNCNALAHVVGAVATNLSFFAVGIRNSSHNSQIARSVVVFGLNVSEAVYARNNHSRVFAETVKYYLQRLFAHFVGGFCNAYRALSRRKALVPCQKAEAFRVLVQKHGSKIAVPQANRALLRNRAGNAKRLQALAYRYSRVGRLFATFFYGYCAPYGVSPRSVLKRYHLS